MLNKLKKQATTDHSDKSFFSKVLDPKLIDEENKLYTIDIWFGGSVAGGVCKKSVVYSWLPINQSFVKWDGD